jgi:hypothetical protein
MLKHVVVVVRVELVSQDREREAEEREAEQGARCREEPFLHAGVVTSRVRSPG